ncbi:hypothetical protein ACIQXI_06595 [Lysinibacillus sp. NPDC097195]|uniref:hypothetical protein n=1 Tax=Lysinibacillus sp. NPDC097195 TaxID=3364141 RepID=UPI0038300F4F
MFKKILLFCAVVTMLAACSNNEATEKNKATNDATSQSQEQQVDQQNESVEQPAQLEQNAEAEDTTSETNDTNEWASLPEYNKIMEQIDNQTIHFEKVTDSTDKRILLIVDENGTKLYKSIFIKNTNRLKIISIEGNGQIFNDTL